MLRSVWIVILIVVAASLCACGLGGPDTSTPEKLAQAVVESIRDNDFEDYSSYFGDKKVILQLLEDSTLGEEEKQEISKEIDKVIVRLEKNKKISFEKIFEKAKADGVDLSTIKYSNATYKLKIDDGVKNADIYVIIEFGDSKYRLKLDDCAESSKGWLMFDEPSWKGAFK